MNFIRSEREDILRNNNNATEEALILMKSMVSNKYSKVIEINFGSLNGDLDLSYLEENFPNIKKVVFEKGKITSIKNIPKTVEKMYIQENLLLDIIDIPKSIEELNISGNYFTSFDFSKTPKLKVFIANDNKIENLQNLHQNIDTLQLNNNMLTVLNLEKSIRLKKLHLLNNPLYKLYNLPENVELKTSNSDVIIEKYEEGSQEDNEEEIENEIEETNRELTYLESIDEFFKIKNKYEKEYKEVLKKEYLKYKYMFNRKKSFIKAQLSSIKPKCVKCGRPVGTIFSIKENRYSAVCGDRVKPCRLHIDIFRGFVRLVDDNLYTFKNIMVETESNIINEKMENILNYKTDESSLKEAKETLNNYNFFQKGFKESLDKYNEIYNNEEKNENIRQKILEINEKRGEIYELLNEYENNTNNTDLLKQSVQVYINELIPIVESLRRTKYGMTDVIIFLDKDNDKKSVSYLLQNEASLSNLEISYGEKPSVKKFII
jgi:hypothetical protein